MNDLDIESLKAEFDEETATDDELKEHFAKTRQLDDEFHNVEGYVAYVHYNQRRARFDQGRSSIGETVDGFKKAGATDQQLRDHFSRTEQLQDVFSDAESYLAFVHHERDAAERDGRLARRHEVKDARAKAHSELVESS